jgi:hypothetical protein
LLMASHLPNDVDDARTVLRLHNELVQTFLAEKPEEAGRAAVGRGSRSSTDS